MASGNPVAWIGQDGNLWYRIGDQTQNWGAANQYEFIDGGIRAKDTTSTLLGQGGGFAPNVDIIDDPVVAGQVSTGDGGASGPALNQAAIDATQQAIDSLDTEFSTGNKNIDDSFNALTSRYDREKSQNKEDFDENTLTNTNNLTRNKQNALLSGAQGLRGLRGVLSSIGALSGTGGELANRAVTTAANQDIGEATDTYAGNARNLDKAWDRFSEEDEDRRAEAQTIRSNQRTELEGKIASKRQNFFQKMAELFGEAGNTAQATEYLGRAGDLNDVIARSSRVGSTPFTARTAAFTPGDLASYLAGAGDMTVRVAPGGAGGSAPRGVFAGPQNRRRREDEEDLA